MKEEFERIIQAGMKELERRQDSIDGSREWIQKVVDETRGKLEALRDMAGAIELRTLKDWDAILIGVFDYPQPGGAIHHVQLVLDGRSKNLDVFHSSKPLLNEKSYHVVLLFQEIPEEKR